MEVGERDDVLIITKEGNRTMIHSDEVSYESNLEDMIKEYMEKNHMATKITITLNDAAMFNLNILRQRANDNYHHVKIFTKGYQLTCKSDDDLKRQDVIDIFADLKEYIEDIRVEHYDMLSDKDTMAEYGFTTAYDIIETEKTSIAHELQEGIKEDIAKRRITQETELDINDD